MESEESEVKELRELRSIPLPDARTAYQLNRVKDRVYGTVIDWELVQREYWPVIEVMEDLAKANDRNGAFILWLLKQVPGDDVESMRYRNEIHRRIGTAFLDPDRKKDTWHTDETYFQEIKDLPPIVWARDVVEREIEWLWPGRIPQGKLVTLAGPGGVGKSFLLCDMAARVSSGTPWPFSEDRAPVGNVLIISGEDEIEDTIRPRLRLQGADLGRVAFPSPVELMAFNLGGSRFKEVADRMLKQMGGASLMIIDPPSSFLAGIDENSNAEVRGFLTPMKEWAHANNCTVIFNTHVNKASGKKLDIQQRVIGSVAMVNGPRMSHMVVQSEDDPGRQAVHPAQEQHLAAAPGALVPDRTRSPRSQARTPGVGGSSRYRCRYGDEWSGGSSSGQAGSHQGRADRAVVDREVQGTAGLAGEDSRGPASRGTRDGHRGHVRPGVQATGHPEPEGRERLGEIRRFGLGVRPVLNSPRLPG